MGGRPRCKGDGFSWSFHQLCNRQGHAWLWLVFWCHSPRGSPITTFQGSVTNGPATSVQFSGTSKGVNSQSKWTSSSSSSSKESSFSSSTIGGTGLTGSTFGSIGFGSSSLLGSNGISSFGGSSGLSSSGFGSTSGLSSSNFGTSSASKFSSSEGQVVESVLSA